MANRDGRSKIMGAKGRENRGNIRKINSRYKREKAQLKEDRTLHGAKKYSDKYLGVKID